MELPGTHQSPDPSKQTSSWIQGHHQRWEGPCRITKQIKQRRASGQPANKNILREDAVRWARRPTQQWAANLGFRRSASPHIWRGRDNQCQTVLEIRYPGYQEVDSTSTSLAKHALIFQVRFSKAVFCLELHRLKLCAGNRRGDRAGECGDVGSLLKSAG